MGNSTRRLLSGTSFFMMILLGVASFAWACTEGAAMSAGPNSGPAGSSVVVQGAEFTEGKVEIRWNSTNGQLLAETSGPRFSVAVTIPQVPPDNYTIFAIGSENALGQQATRVASFEVTGDVARSGSGAGQQEAQRSSNGSTSAIASGGQERRSTSQASSGSGSGAEQSSSSESVSASGSGAEDISQAGSRSTSASGSTGRASSGSRGRNPTSASLDANSAQRSNQISEVPSADRPTELTSSGDLVFGGSVAPRARSEEPNPSNVVAGIPSEGSAFDNAWAGFDSVRSLGSLSDPVPGQQTDERLTVGMLLLAVGLVSLAGGMLVAQVRRRRVRTTS